MIYRLIFLNGPRAGEHFTVPEETMTFGRDASCTVAVPDPEMARQHAAVEQKGEELFIRDLGSMSRILVNKRETREARIKHGDEIELGRTRFVVQAAVQADVDGDTSSHRRKYRAAWAVAALAAAGVILALSARHAPRSATTAADAPAAPTVDVASLKQEIASMQATVKEYIDRKAVPSAPEPGPGPGPVVPEEQAMLTAAQAAAGDGRFTEADEILLDLQRLVPEFIPAYEERARVLEQLGRKGEAAAQWSEVLRRSVSAPHYQRAVAERIRLSSEAVPTTSAGDPAARIASVKAQRFPSTDEIEDLRVVQVDVEPAVAGVAIGRHLIEVEVKFFDRDLLTGEIVLTEATVTQDPLRDAVATASASDRKTASATYAVPRALRAEQRVDGRNLVFHGYRVRLFQSGVVQDEAAFPKSLAAGTAAAPDSASP